MKNLTRLLLAAGSAVILAGAVHADQLALSPRAQANQPAKFYAGSSSVDLVRGQNDLGLAAGQKASGGRSVIAGVSTNDPDLVRADRTVTASPKGLEQLRDSGRDFQVAPLK